jgi:hypothetical protein
MSYKKFVVVFSSFYLFALASGTAWASYPIVFNVRIAPEQPAPFTLGHITALNDSWLSCTWVAASCPTGSFHATLRQNHSIATLDIQLATAEIPILTQHPAARSGQNPSLVSSEPGRVSPLPGDKNGPDSTLICTGVFPGAGGKVTTPTFTVIRTGVFPVAQEKVTTNVSAKQVRTGVFEGPEGFLDEVQDDRPGNIMRLGFWLLPAVRGRESGTGSPHGVQEPQPRKKGSGDRILSRSRRMR